MWGGGTVTVLDPLDALRESEERFRQLVELSLEPIVVHSGGRLLYVNPAGARLVGASSPDELLGRPVLDFVHPDYREQVVARARAAMEGRVAGLVEEQLLRLDGSPIDVETLAFPTTYQGQPAVQVLIRDISARKRAVDRVFHMQAITSALSGASTPEQVAAIVTEQVAVALGGQGAMVAVRSPDGSWVEVLGAVGLPPDQVERYRRFALDAPIPLARAIQGGEPLWPESPKQRLARYPHLADGYAAAGGEGWVSLPLSIEGRVVGGLSVRFVKSRTFAPDEQDYALALGAQCAQALERSLLYGKAQQAISARDEFLSVAAHELKTPLTSLQATAELWLRRVDREAPLEPARVRHAFQMVAQQSRRLARFVELLLDASRLETGKFTLAPEQVDLARIVCGSVVAAAEATPHQRFVLDAPSALEAEVDPLRFEQVAGNLLANASKYSPPGTIIEVVLKEGTETVELSVRDHGPGIPPEHREGIFGRYHQAHAHSHQSGLGLGLYICREIVEQHGGSMRAEFPDDGGSRFQVVLPRSFCAA